MISVTHLVIVLVIVLVLFGPSRLEKLGPSLGKAIKGFKEGITGEDEKDKKKESTESDTEKKT